MRFLVSLIAVLLLVAPSWAQTVATAPAQTLADIIDNHAATARSIVAIQVIDLQTDEVLFERLPDTWMTPASNMKLYTSAAALAHWGPDHRFATEIRTSGPVTNGVLEGDLILRGMGNPVLTTAQLRDFLHRVVTEHGIQRVSGSVLVDATLYDSRLKGPGWMWDDDPDAYNMSVSPLMLNFNVLTARVTEQDGALVAALDPPSDWPPVQIQASPGQAVRITREPFTEPIIARAAGSGAAFQPVSTRLTMHNPAAWISAVAHRQLTTMGIDVAGGYNLGRASADMPVLGVDHSAPLSEILPLFNKPSENAIGEVLLLNLAVESGTVPATWNAGGAAIGNWLTATAGLEASDFRIADGSGLSRYNIICASGTIKLLRTMWHHEHRQVYLDSLPAMGVDGTLRSRGAGHPAGTRVLAKTGTMASVSCLSGYVQTAGGGWAAFSLLVNGINAPASGARDLQDRVCAALAAWELPAAE